MLFHEGGNTLRAEGTSVYGNASDDSFIAMPQQRGSSARMNFFKRHAFHESDVAVSIEMTSDSVDISDISGNMSEVTSTRSGRKRKSMCFMNDKKGEVSSIGRGNVAEKEVFADAVTQVGQNLIVDSEIVSSSASGQAMYQKSKGDVVIDYNDDGDDEYRCNHCDANIWYREANKRQSKRAPIIYTGCCQK